MRNSVQLGRSLISTIFASQHTSVLVSAGIESIFFLVVGIVLCFGYSMRIMLITH